ncbi:MAG: sigma-70 family RNA polymerase sigma factor [Clostridia bacterium]|nr:sigma-70 family RNA polymerase sigma factor [Clostridia bacterium]
MITINDFKKNESLLEEFIRENQRLVSMVIKKQFSYVYNTAEYEDYFQSGCIGLVNAAKRFKPEYGTAFSTYAVSLIAGEIMRYRRDYCASGIHSSRNIKDKYYRYQALRNRGVAEAEACRELGVDSAELNKVINAMEPGYSLDAVIYENDSGTPLTGGDITADDFNLEEEAMDWLELEEILRHVKNILSESDRKIFNLYLQKKTQTQMKTMLGMSQANISRRIRKIKELCRYVKDCYDKGLSLKNIRGLNSIPKAG